MAVPDTTGWRINPIYLQQALVQFCFKEGAVFPDVKIDFYNFDQFIRGLFEVREEMFFVVPAWPGAEWYYTLSRILKCDGVELPNIHHLFLNYDDNPLGKFTFKIWIFKVNAP